MSKEIVQHAILQVVQRQIVRYTCDRCGKVCGTKENRKTTWYGPHRVGESHYCMKTCHPSDHPGWVREHVLNCASCYERARDRGERWMSDALLETLAGKPGGR